MKIIKNLKLDLYITAQSINSNYSSSFSCKITIKIHRINYMTSKYTHAYVNTFLQFTAPQSCSDAV